MKTEKIERISYDYRYVAADGTEFVSEDECRKYEQSAAGVLRGRVKATAVFESNEEDIFGCGGYENKAWVVVPKSVADIMLIRQLIMCTGGSEDYANGLGDDQIGKPVVLLFGYENDGCWYTTFDGIFSKATGGKFKVVEAE